MRIPLRVGVVSDVHADLAALDAALDLLRWRGADRVVCLGDVVEKGPDGDAVVARLEGLLVPGIAGNHEHNALRHAALPLEEGEEALRPETLAALRSWPIAREYLWAQQRVVLAHGSPHDNGLYVFPGPPCRGLKRQLRSFDADFLLLGHTHRPMDLRYGGLRILNPGSVCRGRTRDSHTCGLLDLPEGRWAVLDIATGEEAPVEVLDLASS